MTTDKKNINRKKVAKLVRQLLIELGENPDREGLAGTPNRIADMYEEIFGGYRMDAQLDVSFSEETEAVIAKDIQFYSMCEHHMLPFFGKIHVAAIKDLFLNYAKLIFSFIFHIDLGSATGKPTSPLISIVRLSSFNVTKSSFPSKSSSSSYSVNLSKKHLLVEPSAVLGVILNLYEEMN